MGGNRPLGLWGGQALGLEPRKRTGGAQIQKPLWFSIKSLLVPSEEDLAIRSHIGRSVKKQKWIIYPTEFCSLSSLLIEGVYPGRSPNRATPQTRAGLFYASWDEGWWPSILVPLRNWSRPILLDSLGSSLEPLARDERVCAGFVNGPLHPALQGSVSPWTDRWSLYGAGLNQVPGTSEDM